MIIAIESTHLYMAILKTWWIISILAESIEIDRAIFVHTHICIITTLNV